MLSDFELQRLRSDKKRQEQAKSPAVEVAMRLSGGKPTEKQLRQALSSPFIDVAEPPEIVTATNADPVRETLKAGGYIITEG